MIDRLTLFGLFSVTAMVFFYALERRSPWFVLAFAGSCALGSVYGFLQGAWPFGVVEAVWAVVAVERWRRVKAVSGHGNSAGQTIPIENQIKMEEKILDHIRQMGKVRRADLLPHVPFSKSTLVRLLDKMEAEGRVAQVGERKASYYVVK